MRLVEVRVAVGPPVQLRFHREITLVTGLDRAPRGRLVTALAEVVSGGQPSVPITGVVEIDEREVATAELVQATSVDDQWVVLDDATLRQAIDATAEAVHRARTPVAEPMPHDTRTREPDEFTERRAAATRDWISTLERRARIDTSLAALDAERVQLEEQCRDLDAVASVVRAGTKAQAAKYARRVDDDDGGAATRAEINHRLMTIDDERRKLQTEHSAALAALERHRAALADFDVQAAHYKGRQPQPTEISHRGNGLDDLEPLIDLVIDGRLESQPRLPDRGVLPLLADEPWRDLPPFVRDHTLAALERLAPAVQIVVFSDEPVVVKWAKGLGDRAAIVQGQDAIAAARAAARAAAHERAKHDRHAARHAKRRARAERASGRGAPRTSQAISTQSVHDGPPILPDDETIDLTLETQNQCVTHTSEFATQQCDRCSLWFCRQCLVTLDPPGRTVCLECALVLAGVRATGRRARRR
ncbi:MAG TPA: hypothetical protein VF441_03745 [Acidimicrobiia bacterium]